MREAKIDPTRQTNVIARRPRALAITVGHPLCQMSSKYQSPPPQRLSLASGCSTSLDNTSLTSSLKTAELTVTRITTKDRGDDYLSSIASDRAYLVILQLAESDVTDATGKRRLSLPIGSIRIVDLERELITEMPTPLDGLAFHIPMVLFDEFARDSGSAAITELSCQSATLDPIMDHFGRAVLSILTRPEPTNSFVFDYIARATLSHLAVRYGTCAQRPKAYRARLNSRQEQTAKDLLAADLHERPDISRVAKACGLPVNRFLNAFRETTGMPPYRWVRTLRLETAKEALTKSSLSLAQVAYECGFADQSHFTRVFANSIGMTPGAWRRARVG